MAIFRDLFLETLGVILSIQATWVLAGLLLNATREKLMHSKIPSNVLNMQTPQACDIIRGRRGMIVDAEKLTPPSSLSET
jgi:hypothetical protein